MTVEEYFAFEEASETRHEYWDGYIVDMSGGSYNHNFLTAEVAGVLRDKLRKSGGNCRVFVTGLRVETSLNNNYFYPDVLVHCGPPELTQKQQALKNPALVVEILSPSTRGYDKGYKLKQYKSIPGLQYILFIEQDVMDATLLTREGEQWHVGFFVGKNQIIDLSAIGLQLTLAELYGMLAEEAPFNHDIPDPEGN